MNIPIQTQLHSASNPELKAGTFGFVPTFLMLCAMLALPISAQAETGSDNITTKPVGTAIRAWLDEQRNDVNRAEPEPYPAERAGIALRRYESTIGVPSDSAAGARSGLGISSRGGSSGGSAGNTGMTPR